ncbi:hypothetical protein ACN20G_28380 (plasmid) [Streptomyces sp. BI20]|uniref:hypothetical protein n=1 Tax=Streptomyces sp. BI20 TaxID=3403460 RepID=UPI003C707753
MTRAGAEARLDEAGLALWLTDRKDDGPGPWTGRQLLALVGGRPAGRLEFLLHPDGLALSVWMLKVEAEHRRTGLASVLMDALYAAHPGAWIDHGTRSPDLAHWWHRYRDPDPGRNIHNTPPDRWADLFDAPLVAGQRAANAYLEQRLGLAGPPPATPPGPEDEATVRAHAARFREARRPGPDPHARDLYAGARLVLPRRLHRLVHNAARDPAERADLLLHHIGHGNLPFDAGWNTTARAAYEDCVRARLDDPEPHAPATHLVFRVRTHRWRAGEPEPAHDRKGGWLRWTASPGIPVALTGLSWQAPDTPWHTHRAGFTPPVEAAVAPADRRHTAPGYAARYDEFGELRPGQTARPDAPPRSRAVETRGARPRAIPNPRTGPGGRVDDEGPAARPRPARARPTPN